MTLDRPDPDPFVARLVDAARHENSAIVRRLAEGAVRLHDLHQTLPGIPETALGTSLRTLDAAGLVARRVDPGPPLRVLYALTDEGMALAPILVALDDWTAHRR